MGKRTLATRATLDRLASVKQDRREQPRKRPVARLLAEVNTRLRAFGIAVVPASPWDVLYALFPEVKRGWSTSRIAATLNVETISLSGVMAKLSCATAHADHLTAEEMMAAVRRVREDR